MYFHVPSRSFTWNLKIKNPSLAKEIPNFGNPSFSGSIRSTWGGVFSAIFLRVSPFVTPTPWGFPHGGAAGVAGAVATSAVSEPEAEEAASWLPGIPRHPQIFPRWKEFLSSTVGMFKLRYVSKGMLVNMTYPPWKNQHFESKNG